MNNAPSVSLKDLSVHIDRSQLLAPFDLHIESGRWFGIVGPNGGGKSTLLKAIAGLLTYRGDIFLTWPEKKCGKIGYMPQRVSLDVSLPVSVHDYLRIHCEQRPVWRSRKDNQKLTELIH